MSGKRKPNQVDLTLDDGSKCTIYGDMKAIQQIFHGYVKSIAEEDADNESKPDESGRMYASGEQARKEAAQ
jgi:hypothetical protein